MSADKQGKSDKMFLVTLTCRTPAKDSAAAIEDVITFIQEGGLDFIEKDAKEVEFSAFEKAQQEMFKD